MAPTKVVLLASPWMPTGQVISSSLGSLRVSGLSHRAPQISVVGTSALRPMITRSRTYFSWILPNARRLATTLNGKVPRIVHPQPPQKSPNKASTHRATVVQAASAPALTPLNQRCCHPTSPRTCSTTRWRLTQVGSQSTPSMSSCCSTLRQSNTIMA